MSEQTCMYLLVIVLLLVFIILYTDPSKKPNSEHYVQPGINNTPMRMSVSPQYYG